MRFTLRRSSCCIAEKGLKIHHKAKWDSENQEWYIDIKNLDKLINFVNEIDCNRIVLTTYKDCRPEIEIYDDYRE